ncbi:Blue-light-activated histidine kinase [Seminavis robusta]|uniref:Blue-light-activated histidine kinase n=1 Tax=Seminavis robusta TaxID=568900 RepID=A0A9N8H293_9STRA|nr:Blue-light-activated histidine kinase [Seminavis robusta]|eukprot:Sro5_g004540.1 Blue-light-activated histidine kinase (393) ;mRNA; r:182540-184023
MSMPLYTTAGANMSAQAAAAVAQRGTPSTLNLDDIFGDVMFTPDGETVFLSEQQDQHNLLQSGEGQNVQIVASKQHAAGQYVPVPQGGGLATTRLADPAKPPALVMGAAPTQTVPTAQAVPFKKTPQERHHLQFAANPKRKRSSRADRKMSEQQKTDRRERNREHAKRSRIRKKFLLESLQQSVSLLKEENDKLKSSIKTRLGNDQGDKLITEYVQGDAVQGPDGLLAGSGGMANKVLDDPDFSFIKALQTAQQNFVVTDPSLPDNPIVYASQGFLNLTGYSLDQILGRNCRFLQGPETDPKAVEHIRKAIEQGNDMSVCLLNYRVDGTTFWNQFFIAALRDASGTVTNFVGVQCKVSDQYAAQITKQQEEEDAAAAATDGGEDGGDEEPAE